MKVLQGISLFIIVLFLILVLLLYIFQTRLIFFPGKLSSGYKFRLTSRDHELFLLTSDGEKINALFYPGSREDVILYFHGNAGDLSGWQFVSEDFAAAGYGVLIIDYRGYGKSSGSISERGFYLDGQAAYDFLISKMGYDARNILIYGRSIGTGVAVHVASRNPCKGLVLESAYTNLRRLANQKLPFFFPSLYMHYTFDNLGKINSVKCPVVFIHGDIDEIIPASHTRKLFERFKGKKKMIFISGGSHNDLNSFEEHQVFLHEGLARFFESSN